MESDDLRQDEDKQSSLPNLAYTSSNEPLHSWGFINSHRVRTIVVLVVTAIVAFLATFAAAAYLDIANTVKNSGVKTLTQDGKAKAIVDPNNGKPINLVVMGQDTRDGSENASIGGGDTSAGEHQADTTMIVQISADRSYINLVSIPRDSMVNQPACETSKGLMSARSHVMFNSIFANAYSFGGDISSAASCTTTALSKLTGIDLSLFIVADFQGLKKMIDSIGGVDLCIPQSVKDKYTGLNLSKGYQHLDGIQATQYARVRHNFGDGSDIMRTTRQQYLIKKLIAQALSKNYFTNSDQLYQLVRTGLGALQMSEELANINTLVGLAYSLRNFKIDSLYARTVPTEAYPLDPNRVRWASGATQLWAKMKSDQPIAVETKPASTTNESDSKKSTTTEKSDSTTTPDSKTDSTDSNSTPTGPQLDPRTGLLTSADGTLTDPKTGGSVDPETGIIKDPNTGFAMGYADQYLETVVCARSAEK